MTEVPTLSFYLLEWLQMDPPPRGAHWRAAMLASSSASKPPGPQTWQERVLCFHTWVNGAGWREGHVSCSMLHVPDAPMSLLIWIGPTQALISDIKSLLHVPCKSC